MSYLEILVDYNCSKLREGFRVEVYINYSQLDLQIQSILWIVGPCNRMDMGLYVETLLWAPLQAFYRIHVLWAYQISHLSHGQKSLQGDSVGVIPGNVLCLVPVITPAGRFRMSRNKVSS